MSLDFVTLDVFTRTPFRGNPLAIVHVPADASLTQTQKQAIAREFNLSETVFLHAATADDAAARQARVDIFTTKAEVPFAGHPTVGTAVYLSRLRSPPSPPPAPPPVDTLITKAGPLPFAPHDDGGDGDGVRVAVAHDVHAHAAPFAASHPHIAHHPVVSIVPGMTYILARVDGVAALGAVAPDNLLGAAHTYTAHAALDAGWRTGLVATYFWADLGVDEGDGGVRRLRTRTLSIREDPATGSAAAALCCWLALEEAAGGGRDRRFRITQGVEMGRQSEIHVQVTLRADGTGVEEVLLSGTAVKISEGKIAVPTITEL
ncbi:phenazine biosynthesis protein-like protein phzf family [Xylariomycetidae sp. FL0641]|nr:phenazine biosynthesis protein-like protein phzf family [Xylariomycetidae sp. FL0641]